MKWLRKYFFSGLAAFLPFALTVYLLVLMINFADNLLGKFLAPVFYEKFGFYFKGLSILIGMAVIVVLGFLVTNFLGRRLYSFFESLLLKLPFFRQVYPAIKEIAVFIFSRDRLSFKQVVVIEYPRKGIFTFGFLTNDSNPVIHRITGRVLCNVFVPSAPGPMTGYVVMVPKEEVILTDISVEEAVKFIVSGGVLNPLMSEGPSSPEASGGDQTP